MNFRINDIRAQYNDPGNPMLAHTRMHGLTPRPTRAQGRARSHQSACRIEKGARTLIKGNGVGPA
ncbi:hypothetical protein CRG98_024234 [Punica granatum]|uniref:Uncharacterized protein n=1 Tax=Punica granatum TaxID=22663 RepID=A0A2I0JHA8_PUNGR|nr:hypothetical protein CRG98_024234 [Punica granatum]